MLLQTLVAHAFGMVPSCGLPPTTPLIGLWHPLLTENNTETCETKGTAAGVHSGVPGALERHVHMHTGPVFIPSQQKGPGLKQIAEGSGQTLGELQKWAKRTLGMRLYLLSSKEISRPS